MPASTNDPRQGWHGEGGEDIKFLYKGKVDGSSMALHVTAGDPAFEMTAVKVQIGIADPRPR